MVERPIAADLSSSQQQLNIDIERYRNSRGINAGVSHIPSEVLDSAPLDPKEKFQLTVLLVWQHEGALGDFWLNADYAMRTRILNNVKTALDDTRFDSYVDQFNKSFEKFERSPAEVARRRTEREQAKAREKLERRRISMRRNTSTYKKRIKQKIASGELVLDPIKVARTRELRILECRRYRAKKSEQRLLKPTPSAEELQNKANRKREMQNQYQRNYKERQYLIHLRDRYLDILSGSKSRIEAFPKIQRLFLEMDKREIKDPKQIAQILLVKEGYAKYIRHTLIQEGK